MNDRIGSSIATMYILERRYIITQVAATDGVPTHRIDARARVQGEHSPVGSRRVVRRARHGHTTAANNRTRAN
eukprot:1196429-Prorocentrum_minimum.AAC.6